MAKKFDKMNFIDIEMACWEEDLPTKGLFSSFYPEIIQVGVVQLDVSSLDVVAQKSYYVYPISVEISDFCTELTGITKDILKKNGMPFKGVCNKLVSEFGTISRITAGFGEDDNAINRECRKNGVKNPIKNYLNISDFCRTVFGFNRSPSLLEMLNSLGLSFVGTQHNAEDDALNTALLYAEMIKRIRTNNSQEFANGEK